MDNKINLIIEEGSITGSMGNYVRDLQAELSEIEVLEILNFSKIPKAGRVLNYIIQPFAIKFMTRGKGLIHLVYQELAHILNLYNPGNAIVTYHGGLSVQKYKDLKKIKTEQIKLELMVRGIKKANKIIAVSRTAKKDLINFFNIPEEKIRVIYHGINPIFKPVNSFKYDKYKPYILNVGNDDGGRKNVKGVIETFKKVKERYPKINLLQIGDHDTDFKPLISYYNLEDSVKFLGYIENKELPHVYSGAELFLFPSFYEGFGWPPLEAMACGCPVIASNTSSIPEVVGDAGILVDPNNIEEIVYSVRSLLENEKLRRKLSNKGLERAKKFTIKNMAKNTLEVYQEVIS